MGVIKAADDFFKWVIGAVDVTEINISFPEASLLIIQRFFKVDACVYKEHRKAIFIIIGISGAHLVHHKCIVALILNKGVADGCDPF